MAVLWLCDSHEATMAAPPTQRRGRLPAFVAVSVGSRSPKEGTLLAYESNEANGEVVVEGRVLKGSVVNETAVRAAAGIKLAIGAVSFALAILSNEYRPLKVATAVF